MLQNDVGNRFSTVTIVAAISAHNDKDLYPTEVLIKAPEGGLEKPSIVLLNQIRTIDKQRLVSKVGALTKGAMGAVDRAILISLGLVDF